MSITSKIKEMLKEEQELRARLVALVDSLPENPMGVKPLGKSCCIVPFSMVGENKGILSPEYYMTFIVKTRMKVIFRGVSMAKLDDVIQGILKSGCISCHDSVGSIRQKVSPEFIAALKTLWYEGDA